jgi:hypothetical protein
VRYNAVFIYGKVNSLWSVAKLIPELPTLHGDTANLQQHQRLFPA